MQYRPSTHKCNLLTRWFTSIEIYVDTLLKLLKNDVNTRNLQFYMYWIYMGHIMTDNHYIIMWAILVLTDSKYISRLSPIRHKSAIHLTQMLLCQFTVYDRFIMTSSVLMSWCHECHCINDVCIWLSLHDRSPIHPVSVFSPILDLPPS